MLEDKEFINTLKRAKRIFKICDRCRGLGTYMYGNGATYRRGMGVASMTIDICDQCWGSGDADRTLTNIKELEDGIKRIRDDSAFQYIARYFGLNFLSLKKRFLQLADIAEAQTRKRKIPEHEDAWQWNRDWETIAVLIKKLCQ